MKGNSAEFDEAEMTLKSPADGWYFPTFPHGFLGPKLRRATAISVAMTQEGSLRLE